MLLKILKPLVEKLPLLARTYRYIRDYNGLYVKPEMSVHGFQWIGNERIKNGLTEPKEVKLVHNILKDVDLFINIGANQGLYTCIALSKGKKVIAFEPEPLNFNYLIQNIQINNWADDIEAYPLAIGSKKGLSRLYGFSSGASLIPGWAGVSKHSFKLVPTIRLDDLINEELEEKNIFILADIEGGEINMLEGAKRFLELNNKPIWFVEISINEHQPDNQIINPNLLATFNIFWHSGYAAFTADNNFRRIEVEEVENIVQLKIDTINVHNFIFVDQNKTGKILELTRH